jgi:aminoglycoside/choline kinase family phosphotransferase
MNHYRSFTADDAVRAAEAALSRTAGTAVVIDAVRDLGDDQRRNLILRASATDPDGASRSVIIKATRAADFDATAETAYVTSGLVKEWAATTLLHDQAAESGRSGALLAADIAQGVLVFEDYGADLASLVQPLLHGSASEAAQALTAYAIALAQLHTETIGCRAQHARIIRTSLPGATLPPPGHGWIEREPRTVIGLLGGSIPDDDMMLMASRLQSPGPWQALVHGDPCPDNVLLAVDGTASLIDFEFARPGHALLDAVYWRMGFPTCWCAGRVPATLTEQLDDAYRSALAGAVPAVTDRDVFRRECAIIAVIWMFGSLAWLLEEALKEDTEWGIATRRSRILHYLEAAIQQASDADVLRGTRRTAGAWLEDLRGRWAGCSSLALYPAFTTPAVAEGAAAA